MPHFQLPQKHGGKALGIAIRIFAATVGCYYALYAAMFALALVLPLSPADTQIITALIAFLLGVPLVLWIFAERSLVKLSLTLGVGAAIGAALAAMVG